MKIGFDISQTGNAKAGCGYFAENLIEHLAKIDSSNQYYLYATFGDHYWDDYHQTLSINLPNFQAGFKHTNFSEAKNFWRNPPNHFEAQLGNVDILHSNNFFCPPKLKRGKLIYTLYDLSFLEYPDYSTEMNRIACFDGLFKASLNADLIVAISEYTKKHFLKTFPHFPSDRIVVVYPGNRFNTKTTYLAQPYSLRKLKSNQFWLNVGTIEPRKNIKGLLEAYANLRERKPDTHPLIVAGKAGWLEEKITDLIQQLKLTDHVHYLDYVTNDELQWLYQHCFCFVYPSFFEGFGLPVLEAMNYGCAVITSNASSLPEVAGNAALLIDAHQINEIVEAMLRIIHEPMLRQELKNLATTQAKRFTWEKAAHTMLTLYENLIHTPSVQSNFVSKSASPLSPNLIPL